VQHRLDDANNTQDSPFDFTEENYKIVKTVLAKYPKNYKQVHTDCEHKFASSPVFSMFGDAVWHYPTAGSRTAAVWQLPPSSSDG
jgi:hypothetical protein